MKNILKVLFVFVIIFFVSGCTSSNKNAEANMMEKPEKGTYNIDKNNVADTSKEAADQIDPKLIEGNLEDNDFKN